MVTSVPSSYVPPVLDTPPPSAAVTERVYTGINSKRAWYVWSEFSVIVKLSLVESLPSHPVNLYPSFAVAVMVTSVPSSKSPPSVETVPPLEEETDIE